MPVSASSFADSLINFLIAQSASSFNSRNIIKNDFGLLDTTTSGCVYIVLPGPFERRLIGFGNPNSDEVTHTLHVRFFARDDGNPQTTLNKIWQAEKDLADTLGSDMGLSGSAMMAVLRRGTGWDGVSVISVGGSDWIPSDFYVDVYQTTG